MRGCGHDGVSTFLWQHGRRRPRAAQPRATTCVEHHGLRPAEWPLGHGKRWAAITNTYVFCFFGPLWPPRGRCGPQPPPQSCRLFGGHRRTPARSLFWIGARGRPVRRVGSAAQASSPNAGLFSHRHAVHVLPRTTKRPAMTACSWSGRSGTPSLRCHSSRTHYIRCASLGRGRRITITRTAASLDNLGCDSRAVWYTV